MCEVIVGTRKSQLALIQTNKVIQQLKQTGRTESFQIKKFSTTGDQHLNVSLSQFSGRGVFSNEIDEALQTQMIDCAVHSMKDLPIEWPKQLTIAAIPEREDPREALVANDHVKLEDLPSGAIVGTSSLRRVAQIKVKRPDLKTQWIRGPVDSRIEQLRQGDFDAIILAVAGLKRLNLEDVITEYLPLDSFVPAAGQGALAIQCRADDDAIKNILQHIHDEKTALAIQAERALIDELDPTERAPIGSYAHVSSGVITLNAMVLSATGDQVISNMSKGTDPQVVAHEAAQKLIDQGARQVIQEFQTK